MRSEVARVGSEARKQNGQARQR